MTETRILVVDDEEIARQNLAHVLSREGWLVDTAANAEQAGALLRQQDYQLVLTDLRMPGLDGLSLLRDIRKQHACTEVIVITAHATASSAVEAMRSGAFFYIEKPFRLPEVRKIVQEALEKSRLKSENAALKIELSKVGATRQIIASSGIMTQTLRTATQIAPTDCTVLVHGETGSGKELIARHLHQHSARHLAPFIALNCGVLSDELLSNELFGHERGAFTGAAASKPGLLEAAEGGTLFLDEVTEMSPAVQVQLLRVLQEREFFRLGGQQAIRCNIRVIAATNREPEEAVAAGILRQDLYFRLNVVALRVPPLRERKDDIPLLAQHFIARHALRMGKAAPRLAPSALQRLLDHDFPGNIRELENVMERAVALSTDGHIDPGLLPENLGMASAAARNDLAGAATLADVERQHVLKVLGDSGGNKALAARTLGIDRVSLWRKLKSYGLN
ncbi:MAG: sigma-54-dependent transcriptional regulator [Bacteroidota bacterium]